MFGSLICKLYEWLNQVGARPVDKGSSRLHIVTPVVLLRSSNYD